MATYTDAARIAGYLGIALTPEQSTQADELAQVASDWIDVYLGRSWQGTSPAVDELHTLVTDRVYLLNRPVSSVSVVMTRPSVDAVGDWQTLDADEYGLLDPAHGVVELSGWPAACNGYARVSYAYAMTPPTPVALAASMIASAWLGPSLAGLPPGLSSIALGQNDINVKLSDGVVSGGRAVPSAALELLNGYRVVVMA